MRILFHGLLLVGIAIAFAACSYFYGITATIHLDSNLSFEAGQTLMVVLTSRELDEQSDLLTPRDTDMTAVLEENKYSYTLEGGICCGPEPRVWAYAGIDVNGNGFLDADEPIHAYVNNGFKVKENSEITMEFPAD